MQFSTIPLRNCCSCNKFHTFVAKLKKKTFKHLYLNFEIYKCNIHLTKLNYDIPELTQLNSLLFYISNMLLTFYFCRVFNHNKYTKTRPNTTQTMAYSDTYTLLETVEDCQDS